MGSRWCRRSRRSRIWPTADARKPARRSRTACGGSEPSPPEIDRSQRPLQLFDLQQSLALQAGVGEVEAVAEAGDGERPGLRVAPFGELVHLRSLGIGEAQALAHLVEHLAHGVVPRLPEGGDGAVRHLEQGGVTARDHQAREAGGRRRGRDGVARRAQEGREEVTFQVMDGVEGASAREGDGLAERQPHEEGSHQTGTAGGGHHLDVREGDARPLQGLAAHRRPVGEMLAGGDLGHHAAIGAMGGELARNHGRQHPALAVHHGAGGVVAGGLDAEDEGVGHGGSVPRPRPSSPRPSSPVPSQPPSPGEEGEQPERPSRDPLPGRGMGWSGEGRVRVLGGGR